MQRSDFLKYNAQTSLESLAIPIERAEGMYMYEPSGKAYLDLIGGISVAHLGHGLEAVKAAIKAQVDKHLHLMVYGELIQGPQLAYAKRLVEHLPSSLNNVYFTNSGAEAIEGAIKLARKSTGRVDIIACKNSYHGSTTGALALLGDEYWRSAFRPLMPGIRHEEYNSDALIDNISTDTACVILETVRAEVGLEVPRDGWLQAVRTKCDETGTLLILDEVQCGFGKTGTLWAFEQYGIVPDVLVLGKALGAGMPMGAFVSDRPRMLSLASNPVLGHITTFGGHPVCCAAGLAGFDYLLSHPELMNEAERKGQLFVSLLSNAPVRSIRQKGLMIAIELETSAHVLAVINGLLEKGYFADWFLFAPHCIRIAPPLIISDAEIKQSCEAILKVLATTVSSQKES